MLVGIIWLERFSNINVIFPLGMDAFAVLFICAPCKKTVTLSILEGIAISLSSSAWIFILKNVIAIKIIIGRHFNIIFKFNHRCGSFKLQVSKKSNVLFHRRVFVINTLTSSKDYHQHLPLPEVLSYKTKLIPRKLTIFSKHLKLPQTTQLTPSVA